jgi:hypothetical protein
VLVVGQDPAAHEAIARRILVGTAGQRLQGLLTRVGITTSYVCINTYAYSVYGQSGGERHIDDQPIADYRNAWIDAIVQHNPIEAIVTLGHLAAEALEAWQTTAGGQAYTGYVATLTHPTYPIASTLLANWNENLPGLVDAIAHKDTAATATPYGSSFTAADLSVIPAADLPPGLPVWMRGGQAWAEREGETDQEKRATIVVTVPDDAMPAPVGD